MRKNLNISNIYQTAIVGALKLNYKNLLAFCLNFLYNHIMNKYIFAYTVKNQGNPNNYLDVNNATINYILTTSLSAARPNGRDDYSLIITYGGKVKISEETGDKLLDSHCIIYKPFEPHNYTYIASPDSEIYCLHFSGTYVPQILEELNLNNNYYFSIKKTPTISQIVKRLIILLKTKEKNYTTKANYQFLKLLSILSENSNQHVSLDASVTGTKIQPVIEAIAQDASKFKTIKDLATVCDLPQSTFIKIFTKTMGESPINYLNQKKMENALFFLLETDYNMAEIAYTLGFESQFYFGKCFKKTYGIPPLQYRKQHASLSYFTDGR